MYSLVRAGVTMGCLSNHLTVFTSIAVNCEYIKAGLGIKVWWRKFSDQNGWRPIWKQEHFSPAMLWTVNTSKLVLGSKCDGVNFLTKIDEDKSGRQEHLISAMLWTVNTSNLILESKIKWNTGTCFTSIAVNFEYIKAGLGIKA